MKISFFETRTRNSFFQSRASRREREFLFSISCFETRTRNRKSFLMVEREKIKLILTRIPGIENSRYALLGTRLRKLFRFLDVCPHPIHPLHRLTNYSQRGESSREFPGLSVGAAPRLLKGRFWALCPLVS